MNYDPTNPLLVQSDKSILLEVNNPRYEEAREPAPVPGAPTLAVVDQAALPQVRAALEERDMELRQTFLR